MRRLRPGPRRTARRARRGVTLIELAVTLIVLSLLLVMVGPDLVLWLRNLDVRRTAESIQTGLQRARTEAVRRNQNVSFWLVSTSGNGALDDTCAGSSTGRGWVVSIGDPAGACGAAPSPDDAPQIADKWSVGRGAAALPVNALAADGQTGASCLTFNGFGRVATAGCAAAPLASITVGAGTANVDLRPLRIEVSLGGNVRLCDTQVSADDDPRRCGAPQTP